MAASKLLRAVTRPPWMSWSNGCGKGRPLHVWMTSCVTNTARMFLQDLSSPDPAP